ncbi:MAG: hypothetical protein R3C03_09355 [Pirellulaceae bacterium]
MHWQQLKPGDQIRIARLPSTFLTHGCVVAPETMSLYEHLIECREILTVIEICEHGLPWVSYDDVRNEENIYHWLAVDDDGWEMVD